MTGTRRRAPRRAAASNLGQRHKVLSQHKKAFHVAKYCPTYETEEDESLAYPVSLSFSQDTEYALPTSMPHKERQCKIPRSHGSAMSLAINNM